jgi:HD-GYP domain-containing protein (c-di-GMP phosphodiesterase class II)
MSQEIVSKFISHMTTAMSSCSLYSEMHPLFEEFSEKALQLVKELYQDDAFSLLTFDNSLIFNNVPLAAKGMHVSSFLKTLKKKKIEKVVFRKGLEVDEFKKFIIGMASRGTVSSGPHLSVGIVEVKLKAPESDVMSLVSDGISKFQGVCQEISKFRTLDIIGLDDAVLSFISTLKKESNVLRIVSPVKSCSDYTYVHAANVSVLTMFQAESLGLKGELLHDIGLAGLLHDVGKMFVSSAVLEKQARLSEDEWAEMKKHPVHGAMYLSKLPDVPPLTIIAAFEHHMRFDGSGYPGTSRCGKKQHIVSQMVAIADVFDALRTERPYRKALDVRATTRLIKEGAGKEFNPALVDSFLSSLEQVTEKSQYCPG